MSKLSRITTETDPSQYIVAVNESDGNPDYLANKLKADGDVSITTEVVGGQLVVTIGSTASAGALNSLTDVSTAGAAEGDVLAEKSDGTYHFITPVTSLGDLDDVTDTSTDGQMLTSDGAGAFAFETPVQDLGDLGDVDDTSSVDQVLTSDGAGAFTFETMDTYDYVDSNTLTADETLVASTMISHYTLIPAATGMDVTLPLAADIIGKEVTFTMGYPTYSTATEAIRTVKIFDADAETIPFYENGESKRIGLIMITIPISSIRGKLIGV